MGTHFKTHACCALICARDFCLISSNFHEVLSLFAFIVDLVFAFIVTHFELGGWKSTLKSVPSTALPHLFRMHCALEMLAFFYFLHIHHFAPTNRRELITIKADVYTIGFSFEVNWNWLPGLCTHTPSKFGGVRKIVYPPAQTQIKGVGAQSYYYGGENFNR